MNALSILSKVAVLDKALSVARKANDVATIERLSEERKVLLASR